MVHGGKAAADGEVLELREMRDEGRAGRAVEEGVRGEAEGGDWGTGWEGGLQGAEYGEEGNGVGAGVRVEVVESHEIEVAGAEGDGERSGADGEGGGQDFV